VLTGTGEALAYRGQADQEPLSAFAARN